MKITDMLAIYGAIVSTWVAAWNVYKYYWHEHPRLRVRAYVARTRVRFLSRTGWAILYDGEQEENLNPPFLAFEITNIGGRDIIVTEVVGGYRTGPTFRVHNDDVKYPQKLAPGEFFRVAASPEIKFLER